MSRPLTSTREPFPRMRRDLASPVKRGNPVQVVFSTQSLPRRTLLGGGSAEVRVDGVVGRPGLDVGTEVATENHEVHR